jgi:hypothetical protein
MKQILIILAVLCSLSTSCKKETSEPSLENHPDLISQTISVSKSGSDTTNYYYDNQDRIIKTIFQKGSYFTYEYGIASVTLKSYYSPNLISAMATYILDSNGNAVKSINVNYYSDHSICNQDTSIFENVPGKYFKIMSHTKLAPSSDPYSPISTTDTTTYAYFENNISEIVMDTWNTYSDKPTYHAKWKYSYTYYDDKISTIGNANHGINFLQFSSQNLVKTYTLVVNDVLLSNVNFTYLFDNQNYVITQKWIEGTDTTLTHYHYK